MPRIWANMCSMYTHRIKRRILNENFHSCLSAWWFWTAYAGAWKVQHCAGVAMTTERTPHHVEATCLPDSANMSPPT